MNRSIRWISFFLLLIAGGNSWAAKILTVKQNKALIDLESDRHAVGTQLFAVDEQGKRRGIVVIQQVKGKRAIAVVSKGTVQPNFMLLLSSKNKNQNMSETPKGARAWGFLGGYSNNTLNVTIKNQPTINMTGSSFSMKLFYQEQLSGRWGVRGSVGYDSMNVKGTSTSTTCQQCEANIGYLGLDALIRYNLTTGSTKVWAGAGLGFLFAMSKSSNALDTSKISINQTVLGSVGMDFGLSGGSFVPIELGYVYFPNTNTSSANQMVLKIGYGFSF